VVHGGGPRIKRELDKKKIVSKFINGLRVTDKNIIDTVEEVLIDFNKDIASSLKKLGSQAAMFHSKADNIIEVEPEREELGFVGIPNKINDSLILNALNENKIPIIAPLGLGKNEQTYNINGDTAASAIAKKLKSRRLILMTNVEGVYDDKKNNEILKTLLRKDGQTAVAVITADGYLINGNRRKLILGQLSAITAIVGPPT